MPVPMVAGNWKMNTSIDEARTLASEICSALDPASPVEVVLCPPFVSLYVVNEVLRGSSVKLGAQNMHHEEKGAYTGEVSRAMLSDMCQYVILGHSERRLHFGETGESINLKVKAAISAGIRPILCVGETLEERREGSADLVVSTQVRAGLADITDIGDVAIAYEPVWAIGTGEAATPDVVEAMMGGTIRSSLSRMYGEGAAAQIPLLYGGSVNSENAAQYASIKSVDGSLCGGSSLRSREFLEIVKLTAQAKKGKTK